MKTILTSEEIIEKVFNSGKDIKGLKSGDGALMQVEFLGGKTATFEKIVKIFMKEAIEETKKQWLSKDDAEKLRISSIHRYALDVIKLIDEMRIRFKDRVNERSGEISQIIFTIDVIELIDEELKELKSKIK